MPARLTGKKLPPEILAHCRELRQTATLPENVIWSLLRNHRFKSAKFRRQHILGGYILDFYCPEARLAIELDGSGHLEESKTVYDQKRTEFLESRRITVIRFWNDQVLNHLEDVLGVIWEALPEKERLT
jgi:very-short-patch-repair endonuclease